MARTKSNKALDPAVAISSIGEKLRKARETRGISLDEAHKSTRIHPKILRSLEEDKLEETLGKTYVKSFLKKYSLYLGLNEKEIIEEYAAKSMPEISGKKPILAKDPVLPGNGTKFTVTMIMASAAVILIAFLTFVAVRFVVTSAKHMFENKKAVMAEKAEAKEARETAAPAAAKKELIAIPKSTVIAVTITTKSDVWLRVSRDGELTFHGILPKNSKETWQADKEIILSEIGKPESLDLSVNGQSIDNSKKTISKRILITREGIEFETNP